MKNNNEETGTEEHEITYEMCDWFIAKHGQVPDPTWAEDKTNLAIDDFLKAFPDAFKSKPETRNEDKMEISPDWISDDIYNCITAKYKTWAEDKFVLIDADVYFKFSVRPFFKPEVIDISSDEEDDSDEVAVETEYETEDEVVETQEEPEDDDTDDEACGLLDQFKLVRRDHMSTGVNR